jgi:prepilin-type N-terminal cleavage/methylation domain-containing protein
MLKIFNDQGFSLIEVFIAMAVLSVVLLGMAGLINITVSVNRNSGEKTAAITLAQDKMEETLAMGYTDLPSMQQTIIEDYDSLPNAQAFKRITDIKVDKPDFEMKLITVDVYWHQDNRQVRLQSILSKTGSEIR